MHRFSASLRFLASLKLAVILIAGIALMSVLATIYPEANAFQSWPFRIVVAAFFLNLLLCTVKLLPGFWRQLHRTAADVNDVRENNHGQHHCYAGDREKLLAFLQEQHYKVSEQQVAGQIKLLAKKGTMSLFAPHLLHMSILVVIIGAMLYTLNVSGAMMSYIDNELPLPPVLREVYGSDSRIEVQRFDTHFDEAGAVDNWVTTFDLYLDGQLVAENAETKVNAPFQYRDLVIYQNSYGMDHIIEVSGSPEPEENGTFAAGDNEPFYINGLHTIIVNMGKDRNYLQITNEKEVLVGQFLQPEDHIEIMQGVFLDYYTDSPFTVLELKTDRGVSIVFFGFILATIASLLFCSGRYRELRIVLPAGIEQFYVQCYSKNTMVVEEMEEMLATHWKSEI